LFDEASRLVGITSTTVSSGQNLNFAVPAERLRELETQAAAEEARILIWQTFLADYEEAAHASNWKRQRSVAEAWVAMSPSSAIAWSALSSGRDNDCDRAGALLAVARALELDSNHAPAWWTLGQLRSAEKRDDQAMVAFARYVELRPNDRAGWENLADAAHSAREWSVAVDARRRQLSLLPPSDSRNRAFFQEKLAGDLLADGKPDAATGELEIAVKLDPSRASAWRSLERLYLDRHDTSAAARTRAQVERLRRPQRMEDSFGEAIGFIEPQLDRCGRPIR
jgi:tetratricopeptide (TPR) repeat protein